MRLKLMITGLTSGIFALPLWAENGLEIIGQPVADGIGFQPAANKLARDLQWLDGMVLIIITAITVLFSLVLALMVLPVLVELAARGQESLAEDTAD